MLPAAECGCRAHAALRFAVLGWVCRLSHREVFGDLLAFSSPDSFFRGTVGASIETVRSIRLPTQLGGQLLSIRDGRFLSAQQPSAPLSPSECGRFSRSPIRFLNMLAATCTSCERRGARAGDNDQVSVQKVNAARIVRSALASQVRSSSPYRPTCNRTVSEQLGSKGGAQRSPCTQELPVGRVTASQMTA